MSSEIRLGLIGCGRIMPAHLRGYRTLRDAGYGGFRITALLARKEDDALRFRRRGEGPPPRAPASSNPGDPLGAPHMYVSDVHDGEVAVYTELEEMLAQAPIDAVEVYTTHPTHHSIAIQALEAGKHVAVEKPMAMSVKAAQRMIEAAEAAGKLLFVLENARYNLGTRAAAWAANSGTLGDLQLLLSLVVGIPEWSPDRVLGHTRWRHSKLAAGGVAIDFGVHLMDWARQVAGELDEVSALARTLEPVRREYDEDGKVIEEIRADAEDTFLAHVTFEGGAVGEFGFCAAGHGEPIGLPGGRAVYGTRGCLKEGAVILDDGSSEPLNDLFEARADADVKDRLFPLGLSDSFALEKYDFLTAIESGREPEMTGEEGLKDLAAAFAVLESSHAGCAAKVADVESGAVSAYQDVLNAHWGLE